MEYWTYEAYAPVTLVERTVIGWEKIGRYAESVEDMAVAFERAEKSLPEAIPAQEPRKKKQRRPIDVDDLPDATGTGFAISSDGLVLTAFHVVDGASRIRATFADGQALEVDLFATTPSCDLAVLEAKGASLQALPLIDSRTADVGDHVFTVGFPAASILGREPKYTDGSLSAKSGLNGRTTLLQVSIPIQPGNSGGPILLDSGEAIGVISSTAAVSAFLNLTGSLPQNINWGIKAEYARLMIPDETRLNGAAGHESAVHSAMNAICFIEVWK
ncbi:serine protease [bacterium]|nr:serine protease [bacterium]